MSHTTYFGVILPKNGIIMISCYPDWSIAGLFTAKARPAKRAVNTDWQLWFIIPKVKLSTLKESVNNLYPETLYAG